MSDREVLEASVRRATELIDDGVFEVGAHWHVLVAAARERLAELPEKCEHLTNPFGDYINELGGCDRCGNTDKVYPAETVERIRAAVGNTDHWDFDSGFGCWTEPSIDKITVAVLDALNGETS